MILTFTIGIKKRIGKPFAVNFSKQLMIKNHTGNILMVHFLKSITRVSGAQTKTLSRRIKQMGRKAYGNNEPDMRNPQISDAYSKQQNNNSNE